MKRQDRRDEVEMVALSSAVTEFVCFQVTLLCPVALQIYFISADTAQFSVLGNFLMETNNPIYQWLSTVEDQEQSCHQDGGMLLSQEL